MTHNNLKEQSWCNIVNVKAMNRSKVINAIAGGPFVAIFPAGWISSGNRETCQEVAEKLKPGNESAQILKHECSTRATQRTRIYYAIPAVAAAVTINNTLLRSNGDE